ncbi:unnamed protein product [Chondrus crispus]|uniref:Aminotransferase class I/classII large domain-containing protein n=1 Tax=Chondrus crispus TaxID=2769 RepID=R7QC34_CHOCR|nr:unnamed protein product [Chondrus crispus]CDF35358.1 unnamed protein product [Chondrus crispus]|eukprot:XP_005715177.1 unnamed protein product [Chondrus crispus]
MLVVCSPNNPTGEVLDKETVVDVVRWARANGLHVVFDEVYANSVHAEGKEFCSVASALQGDLGDDVHVVWSFSKDFCLSGARVGILYSQNRDLMRSVDAFLSPLMSTSTPTQWALQAMIEDQPWLDDYFAANRRRLRHAYSRCTALLDDMAVPYVNAHAGLFVWADFRKWMSAESEECEMHLWRRFCDAKVFLTPASQCFGQRYGFFRICFAAVDVATCQVALNRIKQALVMARL